MAGAGPDALSNERSIKVLNGKYDEGKVSRKGSSSNDALWAYVLNPFHCPDASTRGSLALYAQNPVKQQIHFNPHVRGVRGVFVLGMAVGGQLKSVPIRLAVWRCVGKVV